MASRNAKGRMIFWKISYCKQLSRCSMLANLLFTWLLPNLDDLGRMEGDPEIIKGMIFPYHKDITPDLIMKALKELNKEKLIIHYMVGENWYIQYPNFSEYQKLRQDRTYKSDYPSIPQVDMTSHDESRQDIQELREGEEKEKRSEGEGEGESSKIFADDSIQYQLALKLKQYILRNNPNARTPNDLQKWALEFDRMIRIDKREPINISEIMEFSQTDTFWISNILSASKLREKFDTLFMQNKGKKPINKQQSNIDKALERVKIAEEEEQSGKVGGGIW